VEDRSTKKNFAGGLKFAATLKAEMMKRGVVTRTRPAVGPHPAPGDVLFFAPPLVTTEADVDRLVSVARDAVKAVVAAVC
jgi:L-2,4-diaminobutyrate transaminase